MKRIAVTGGAGQIAYSLLFRIASGQLFGKGEEISLHILEIPAAMPSLEGVLMELEDCAFPLLHTVHASSDPDVVFEGAEYAFLIGSQPRGPGMERKDLLEVNGQIFVSQGKSLNRVASRDVKVLVVGNPCNTNCLIAQHNAPRLKRGNFHAMTRLDQNRAVAQLAKKSGRAIAEIRGVTIWGNHSLTQVPSCAHATIGGTPADSVIQDPAWFADVWVPNIQQRGGKIITARGKSSAASAASAAIDAMRSLVKPSQSEERYSSGVTSAGNPYGIEPNLIFSFPCQTEQDGTVQIVPDLAWSRELERQIRVSEQELIKERSLIEHLL